MHRHTLHAAFVATERQQTHALSLVNRLVRAHPLEFVSLPHGQGLGWVTCTVRAEGQLFSVTSHEDGRLSVAPQSPHQRMAGGDLSAADFAAALEAKLLAV